MSNKSRFALAVEELEEEAAAAVTETDEGMTPAVDAETTAAVDEVAETSEAGDADLAQVDDAAADADALDAIADKVDAVAETDEGMTPAVAELVEVAVERIYSRLHLKSVKMPAAESFGSARDRKASTKMAAESISDQAKKVWAAIMKFFQQAVEWVKGFYAKLFDGNTKLKAAAKQVMERAKAINGSAKESEIAKGGFVAALEMGGKFDVAVVNTGLKTLTAFNAEVMSGVAAFGKQAADLAAKPLTGEEKVSFDLLKGLKATQAGEVTVLTSEELPGNKALRCAVTPDWKTAAELTVRSFATLRPSFGTFDEKAEGFKGEKVPTATPAQAEQMANAVMNLAEEVDKTKGAAGQLSSDLAAFVAAAKKQAAGADGEKVKVIQKFMQRAGAVVQSIPAALTSHSIKCGKHALDYAGASLKQYK